MSRRTAIKYGRGSTSMDEKATVRGSSETGEDVPKPKELPVGRLNKKTSVRGDK